ncbi:hypothetical protein [Litoribrevibacter albus]|uniref:Uncharacterized protein n=1 Tax=Litoribrevibacter albus TaxID=1473156 RepID=A0AA37W556_9GAMM|nr:hypothetical protein [Litoribrevibacter albus]GLQ30235.1 hypothetical protein GCM10007876_07130 [Litoribrevibacter albus]
MPIANCVVNKDFIEQVDETYGLVELWADASSKSSEHMTMNIVYSDEQYGNRYAVMAHLFLPTLWSAEEVSSLQLGLAKALACYFQTPLNDIHVITTSVVSGMVVEQGKEVIW